MFWKLSMTLSVLSSKASLIWTIPCLGNTPSDIDFLTFIGLFVKFIINLKSFQTYTLAALSISQQFCFWPCNVKILGYQLFILGICSIFMILTSCVIEALQRFFCDPRERIWLKVYLAYNLRFFSKHRSM